MGLTSPPRSYLSFAKRDPSLPKTNEHRGDKDRAACVRACVYSVSCHSARCQGMTGSYRGLSLTFANHGHSQPRRGCLDNNRVGCFPLKASFLKCHLNGGCPTKRVTRSPCHHSPCQASTTAIFSLLQLISLSSLDTAIVSLLRPLFLFCCHSALRPPSSPQPLSSQHFSFRHSLL